jgi:hypothetical protein
MGQPHRFGRAPREGEGRRHGRRRHQFPGFAAGVVIGWLIGFGLEYAVGPGSSRAARRTRSRVAFGLPLALAVAFGLMLGAGDVDAPGERPPD